MPFAPHWRMTALGTLGSGEERFSYSLSATGGGDPGAVDPLIWAAIAGTFKVLHTSTNVQLHPAAVLTGVKFASIGADGKYTHEPYTASLTAGAGQGSGVGTVTLPQSALAVSLVTGRLGPGGRGRFYLPMPMVEAISTDGFQIPLPAATSIRNAAQVMLNVINQNLPGSSSVCVASTKGYNTVVTGVRLGRLVDTIRSRRANLTENYTAVAAVTP